MLQKESKKNRRDVPHAILSRADQVHARLQLRAQVVPRRDEFLRDAADAIRSSADGVDLHGGNTAASGSDAAGVARVAAVHLPSESGQASEIKGGECAGFPEVVRRRHYGEFVEGWD